jgi:hypothetical protein
MAIRDAGSQTQLYFVFIDGLIRMLKEDATLGVPMVGKALIGKLYADDIVLLAPSPEVLQRMLALTTCMLVNGDLTSTARNARSLYKEQSSKFRVQDHLGDGS